MNIYYLNSDKHPRRIVKFQAQVKKLDLPIEVLCRVRKRFPEFSSHFYELDREAFCIAGDHHGLWVQLHSDYSGPVIIVEDNIIFPDDFSQIYTDLIKDKTWDCVLLYASCKSRTGYILRETALSWLVNKYNYRLRDINEMLTEMRLALNCKYLSPYNLDRSTDEKVSNEHLYTKEGYAHMLEMQKIGNINISRNI